jgi:monomeric sarcosine oxidase
MKIGVVGIGGAGGAAARFLAEAGHDVVGFEQFRIGHDRGSSHGESRIIRHTYPDLLYTRMMGDAYPLWDDLERQAGEELFVRCGGLYFGTEGHPSVREAEQALRETGLPYERLGPEETRERFPAFRLRPDEIALFQKDSGFLRATRCVLANARLARERGAVLHEEAPVREIVPRGAEVIVRTEGGGEWVFDRVVVTAGAWMGKLLADLPLPLRVTRQQIVYLRIARDAGQFAPGRFPVWIDADRNYYGFPNDGIIEGVKLAAHDLGETADPDAVRRTPDEEYVRAAAAYASARFPDLAGEATHAQVCLYTNTPDEDFVVDWAPGGANVLLVSGCSGHGFKFTVLLGKIGADLVTGGSYGRDLRRFALKRFAGAGALRFHSQL